jgi:hypothetical protein
MHYSCISLLLYTGQCSKFQYIQLHLACIACLAEVVRNRFEWVSADSEGKSISLVKKIGRKNPLSEQR